MEHSEIIRRIEDIEHKITDLEEHKNDGLVCNAETKKDIKELRVSFSKMELVLVDTINKQTRQMWKLIFVLVAIFSVLLGIQKIPNIW